jgi:hypothetical protein
MQVIARCPKCDAGLPVDATAAPRVIQCGRCQEELELHVAPGVRSDTAVEACVVCEGTEFYVRRDFNPQIGVAVMVVIGLISAVFYYFGKDLISYSVLGIAVLIDLVVYKRLTDVTVCYRCHSEYRGTYKRTAPAFDLHTADVLELEYERRIGRR